MIMLRHLVLAIAAATLVGIILSPAEARAHYRVFRIYAAKVCGAADYRGWNPVSRNAAQRGYPGPHYGCDCYRAANGRAICPFLY